MLLDEPLANLDYKLREELRDELPRLFADRGCTVVYATTEPAEALLLGGHTATLHEGRVTQFGPNADVYREPADLTTARVFSDPPINIAPVTKQGDRIRLSERRCSWAAHGSAARAARRRVHDRRAPAPCARRRRRAGGVGVEGKVLIAEISGSESVVHFDLAASPGCRCRTACTPFASARTRASRSTSQRCLYFDAGWRARWRR